MTPLLWIVALLPAPQANKAYFDVHIQGQKFGTGTAQLVRLPGGGRREVMTMRVEAGGNVLTFFGENEFDAKGRPTRSLDRQDAPGKKEEIVKMYGAKAATYTKTQNGKVVAKKTLPIGPSIKLINPGKDWFVKSTPKVGTKASYHRVSKDGTWQMRTYTYRGPKTFTIAGKKVVGYEVAAKEGSMWVDRNEIPVHVTVKGEGIPDITLVRTR